MILKNFEIHIVHYELLKERRSYLEKRLKYFDFLAKRKGNKIYLILEDDVILEENFLDKLKKILRILPKDFDIAYTDFGINDAKEYLSVDNLQFKKLDKNHKKTRTTASFFINSKSAKKFSQDIKPFTLPLDHELRYCEVKRFNKSIFSKIQVNLLDLLIFLKNSISVLDKR